MSATAPDDRNSPNGDGGEDGPEDEDLDKTFGVVARFGVLATVFRDGSTGTLSFHLK